MVKNIKFIMSIKKTKQNKIRPGLYLVAVFSLFTFTQCAKKDDNQYRRLPDQSQPQYYQQPRQYAPNSNYPSPYNAPNSRAYSNPYDFIRTFSTSL